ncbi:MAG TPA: cation transporter [Gemmatimonadaceae bacterium]|nr:cation transporter [Gemmatimonadaceae bacterium]
MAVSGELVARHLAVRRGILLSYATIGYNSLEAIGSLIAGLLSGSVALVGFGIDSVIEVIASVAAQWRLRIDADLSRRFESDMRTLRIVGWCFVALAVYVTIDSVKSLYLAEQPDRSWFGLTILALSVIVMPALAWAKRRVAITMQSAALEAEAKQTSLCAYLSVIALAGVGLNAILDWWWADPVAALAMVPIIVREGVQGLRLQPHNHDKCC